jgi:hypothetical protein
MEIARTVSGSPTRPESHGQSNYISSIQIGNRLAEGPFVVVGRVHSIAGKGAKPVIAST